MKFETAEKKLKITIPSDYFLLEGLQIIKKAISTDIFKFIDSFDGVEFLEDYENSIKKAEEKAPEAKTTGGEEKPPEPKAEVPEKQPEPEKREHRERPRTKATRKKSRRR